MITLHALENSEPPPETSRSSCDVVNKKVNGKAENCQDPYLVPEVMTLCCTNVEIYNI